MHEPAQAVEPWSCRNGAEVVTRFNAPRIAVGGVDDLETPALARDIARGVAHQRGARLNELTPPTNATPPISPRAFGTSAAYWNALSRIRSEGSSRKLKVRSSSSAAASAHEDRESPWPPFREAKVGRRACLLA
jgi:hypothetical protein